MQEAWPKHTRQHQHTCAAAMRSGTNTTTQPAPRLRLALFNTTVGKRRALYGVPACRVRCTRLAACPTWQAHGTHKFTHATGQQLSYYAHTGDGIHTGAVIFERQPPEREMGISTGRCLSPQHNTRHRLSQHAKAPTSSHSRQGM